MILAYACLIRGTGKTITGALRVLPVPLSENEHKGLCRSAQAVRTIIEQLGLT